MRAGWRPGDRSARLRCERTASPGIFWREDAPNRELHLSAYHLDSASCAAYVRRIEEFRAVALQAYHSMATWLADPISQGGDAGPKGLRVILLASEDTWEWQLERIQRAFPGTQVFGFCGHKEHAVHAP